MTTNRLYLTWFTELKRMIEDWRLPQVRNLTWLLVGIYLSRSVQLQNVAQKIPARATLVSVTRRLSRFLEGPGLGVRRTYAPIIRPLLAHLARAGALHRLLDGIPVLAAAEGWGWRYALRQKGDRQVQTQPDGPWQAFAALAPQPGARCWEPHAALTARHADRTNLLALWGEGEKEAWLLATNFPDAHSTRLGYRRRAWAEELFGALKGHGFDLETTHLDAILKLSRLTLAVVLLYTWLLASGARVIKQGQRPLVDRADRRDLSLFQIGLRMLERCLTNLLAFTIRFSVVT